MSDSTPPANTQTDTLPLDRKASETETSPKDELTAALAHLKSAADLIANRVAKGIDPAVRKVAADAERALERAASETERTANEIGAAAKPFASRVGAELGRLADEIKKSVAHLEGAATAPKDSKPSDAGANVTTDPDDPSSLR